MREAKREWKIVSSREATYKCTRVEICSYRLLFVSPHSASLIFVYNSLSLSLFFSVALKWSNFVAVHWRLLRDFTLSLSHAHQLVLSLSLCWLLCPISESLVHFDSHLIWVDSVDHKPRGCLMMRLWRIALIPSSLITF